MVVKWSLGVILICLLPVTAMAGKGISYSASIGLPHLSLKNPDGTQATYDGLGFKGSIDFALLNSIKSSTDLKVGFNYFELENNFSNSQITEIAKHQGLFLGLEFSLSNIQLGYNWNWQKADHYFVSSRSVHTIFNYQLESAYVGIKFPVGAVDFCINYEFSNGKINANEINFDSDAKLQMNTIWLKMTFNSKSTLSSLTEGLIK